VEDNEVILFNMKIICEVNGFEPLLAENGEVALQIMENTNSPPDLIISDIMMPKLNGYDFYQKISEHPEWTLIPFIFVSAKSSPEDIRFAKLLGVDDYITKPFPEETLIASIQGKLIRSQSRKLMQQQIHEKINEAGSQPIATEYPRMQREIVLRSTYIIIVKWDDVTGPLLHDYYPKNPAPPYSLESVGDQIYNISSAVYGYKEVSQSEDVLIHIANIGMDGFILFDVLSAPKSRGRKNLVMIALISPKIHYLASERIREILQTIAKNYIHNTSYDLHASWNAVVQIL
jgi:CheY-like chemotaxis protein